jgi:hypothetical protein
VAETLREDQRQPEWLKLTKAAHCMQQEKAQDTDKASTILVQIGSAIWGS